MHHTIFDTPVINVLMHWISRFFLHLAGWRVVGQVPTAPKYVLLAAPHTSNWDFVIGKLFYSSLGRQANFLIKAEWFFFPFNIFFSSIGGIPVKREKSGSLTDILVREFQTREWMHLGITPEGTRKPVKEWKKGFYFIAMKAKVPIILIGLDYGKKEARVLDLFYPTGDYRKDIVEIKAHYQGIQAKKPENFIL